MLVPVDRKHCSLSILEKPVKFICTLISRWTVTPLLLQYTYALVQAVSTKQNSRQTACIAVVLVVVGLFLFQFLFGWRTCACVARCVIFLVFMGKCIKVYAAVARMNAKKCVWLKYFVAHIWRKYFNRPIIIKIS